MKVFNSRDLDWRSARRNLARAFYHSSDFDSKRFGNLSAAIFQIFSILPQKYYREEPGTVRVDK